MSKTIVKKGIEGGIGNQANTSNTIRKTGFEDRGVAPCSQQCKTYDIGKSKIAWMMNAENDVQDCGDPPPPGGDWSDLNPPVLSSDSKGTGATYNVLLR